MIARNYNAILNLNTGFGQGNVDAVMSYRIFACKMQQGTVCSLNNGMILHSRILLLPYRYLYRCMIPQLLLFKFPNLHSIGFDLVPK